MQTFDLIIQIQIQIQVIIIIIIIAITITIIIINIFEVKDLLHRMINGTAKVEPRAEAVPETVGAGR